MTFTTFGAAGAAAGACALILAAGAAQAATQFDADLAPPGVYFGTGNANGHFTIETVDGVELGLRGRAYQENTQTPAGNLYTVELGKQISFDWSFNPGADGTPVALDGLSSLLTITNIGTGGTFAFDALLVPDNETDPGAPGGEQNSWRLSFAFLAPSIDYDMNVDSSYRIDWTVGGDAFDRISNTIYVNQGAGAAIPEPATWALMIAGFGLSGAALRRRWRATAA